MILSWRLILEKIIMLVFWVGLWLKFHGMLCIALCENLFLIGIFIACSFHWVLEWCCGAWHWCNWWLVILELIKMWNTFIIKKFLMFLVDIWYLFLLLTSSFLLLLLMGKFRRKYCILISGVKRNCVYEFRLNFTLTNSFSELRHCFGRWSFSRCNCSISS